MTIRLVFAAEALLVLCSLALAHALLDLDWARHASWGVVGSVAGACVGVTGCALAVSSGLTQRRYRVV